MTVYQTAVLLREQGMRDAAEENGPFVLGDSNYNLGYEMGRRIAAYRNDLISKHHECKPT